MSGVPPLAPEQVQFGAKSETSAAQGYTKFISSRNSRLRVLLVLRSNPHSLSAHLFSVATVSHRAMGARVLPPLPWSDSW